MSRRGLCEGKWTWLLAARSEPEKLKLCNAAPCAQGAVANIRRPGRRPTTRGRESAPRVSGHGGLNSRRIPCQCQAACAGRRTRQNKCSATRPGLLAARRAVVVLVIKFAAFGFDYIRDAFKFVPFTPSKRNCGPWLQKSRVWRFRWSPCGRVRQVPACQAPDFIDQSLGLCYE